MRPLPNTAESQLAEAIRCLRGPGFEAALHGLLRRSVAPDNFVALAFRDAGPPLALYRHTDAPRAFAQFDEVYLSGAYLLDPFHHLHVGRAPPGAYRLSDIAPDAFQRSRYFLDYYRETTIIDEVAFTAYPAPGVSLHISLGRDASSGRPFSVRDVETCQRLATIVTALANHHWADVRAEAGAPEDVCVRLMGALQDVHGIRLSPRQAEVALLVLRGHSTSSIALQLAVSPQTVKVFRRQLYSRCSISSQAELFALLLPLLGSGLIARP